MSYDPSHRRPPRQERWPSATPAKGLPFNRDGEQADRWYQADQGAFAASPGYRQQAGYRYATDDAGYQSLATDAFPPARNGYGTGQGYGGQGYADQGYADQGYASQGYDTNGYGGAGQGYAGQEYGNGYDTNGYRGTVDGYAGARNGYAGGQNGYGGTQNGYGGTQNGYGQAQGVEGWAGNGYGYAGNGYADGDGYADNGYADGGYADNGYAGDGYGWAEDGRGNAADLGPGSYTEYHEPGYREPGYGDPALMAPDAGVHPARWRAEQDRRRQGRQRGMMVGAVTEILGTAVAIGVSTLAAGLFRSPTSPVAAMSSVFIDRTPAVLRNGLVHHFGTHGHTVLLLGMYAVIAFIALVIGVLARRAAALGVAGIAAFTLFAAFVAITRPTGHVGDVTPAIVGGIAGVTAMLWLMRASTPIVPLRHSRGGARRRTR